MPWNPLVRIIVPSVADIYDFDRISSGPKSEIDDEDVWERTKGVLV